MLWDESKLKYDETGELDIGFGNEYSERSSKTEVYSHMNMSLDKRLNKLATIIIGESLGKDASDIKIYQYDVTNAFVELRIGGRMVKTRRIDVRAINGLVQVFKRMAGMSVMESQSKKSGDGRISFEVKGIPYNLRVNSIPSVFCETLSIRIIKSDDSLNNVDMLGMPDLVVKRLRKVLSQSEGMIILSGATGSGKSTAVTTQIPTPEGMKLMGEIKVGDYVYDRLGKPTKVLGVYPQGKLDAYEFQTKYGEPIICSQDHIWTVKDRSKDTFMNKTTQDLLDIGIKAKGRENANNYYLPINGATEKTEKEYKVHPYAMGAFLGDGCLTNKALTLSSEDDWIPNKVANLIGSTELKQHGYSWHFRLPEDYVKQAKQRRIKYFQTRMLFDESLIGLCGTRYIPEEYLEGSIEQRYELLQGLMDTDGTISNDKGKRYNVSFATSSEQLGKDVTRLCRSLGMKVSIKSNQRVREGRGAVSIEYRIGILVPNEVKHKLFSLPRKVKIAEDCKDIKKKARYDRVAIESIKKLDYQTEMVCIEVDNEEGLFQVGECHTVTHNTTTMYTALKEIIRVTGGTKNIHTIEDPVESLIPGTVQNEVNELDGFTYTLGVRGLLRQNPDILLIGEIRDGESAITALRAATSGHLLFSTLHTNNALQVPMVLQQYGLKRNEIASALQMVLNQRLVGKLCEHCKIKGSIKTDDIRYLQELGLDTQNIIRVAKRSHEGCKECDYTGYKGKLLVVEMLDADRNFDEILNKSATDYELKRNLQESEVKSYYSKEEDVERHIRNLEMDFRTAADVVR